MLKQYAVQKVQSVKSKLHHRPQEPIIIEAVIQGMKTYYEEKAIS